MKTIGVRELRQRASEFIAEAMAGRTIEITLHGRAVAMLVPAQATTGRQLLLARGRLMAAHGDLLDLGRPLAPTGTADLPSKQLRRARARER